VGRTAKLHRPRELPRQRSRTMSAEVAGTQALDPAVEHRQRSGRGSRAADTLLLLPETVSGRPPLATQAPQFTGGVCQAGSHNAVCSEDHLPHMPILSITTMNLRVWRRFTR
jgi:hypothetical protein